MHTTQSIIEISVDYSDVVRKGAFIVCCNVAALPIYRLHIYRSSTQRNAPQVHFLAVPQCSSRRRDGNTTTATYRNAVAVDYERTLSLWEKAF